MSQRYTVRIMTSRSQKWYPVLEYDGTWQTYEEAQDVARLVTARVIDENAWVRIEIAKIQR